MLFTFWVVSIVIVSLLGDRLKPLVELMSIQCEILCGFVSSFDFDDL